MNKYPSINWWHGILKPFESVFGFAVRFCALNGLRLQQFEEFFGFKINEQNKITAKDIQRISDLINEDLDIVQSVFYPSHLMHSFEVVVMRLPNDSVGYVRYCRECVMHGYHSSFHDLVWLKKCPIHEIPLEVSCLFTNGKSKFEQRQACLREKMEKGGNFWPNLSQTVLDVGGNGNIECLLDWIKTASSARRRLFSPKKWNFATNSGYEYVTITQELGRLNSLVAIPAQVKHLFADLGDPWYVDIRSFNREVKDSFKKITNAESIEQLIDFFRFVGKYASKNGSFTDKLNAAQDMIRKKHLECHCKWGRIRSGFNVNWVSIYPEDRRHWGCQCPFEVALEELQLGWGRAENILSSRKIEQERREFIRQSKDFFDGGFIGFTPDANVSPDGQLYLYPQAWPCCEWVDQSRIGNLLNTIVEYEIEVTLEALLTWLDEIEHGKRPNQRVDHADCIYLIEKDEGIDLFIWKQKNLKLLWEVPSSA